MNDPRRFLALAAALLLGAAGYIATHHLYTRYPRSVSVSDGQGHGPDFGSGEWQRGFDRIVHSRSVIAGTVAAFLTFAVALRMIPPSEPD